MHDVFSRPPGDGLAACPAQQTLLRRPGDDARESRQAPGFQKNQTAALGASADPVAHRAGWKRLQLCHGASLGRRRPSHPAPARRRVRRRARSAPLALCSLAGRTHRRHRGVSDLPAVSGCRAPADPPLGKGRLRSAPRRPRRGGATSSAIRPAVRGPSTSSRRCAPTGSGCRRLWGCFRRGWTWPSTRTTPSWRSPVYARPGCGRRAATLSTIPESAPCMRTFLQETEGLPAR